MALARLCGGKMSEIMECEGGLPPASPMPTPIRANRSCRQFCTKPLNAVMKLQMNSDRATMSPRLEVQFTLPGLTPWSRPSRSSAAPRAQVTRTWFPTTTPSTSRREMRRGTRIQPRPPGASRQRSNRKKKVILYMELYQKNGTQHQNLVRPLEKKKFMS